MMEDENVWEVDRVAAAELLALLRGAPEADWGTLAATVFSKTRLQSYEWAARRVHGSAMKVLEQEANVMFPHREVGWTDGYRHAEHRLMAKSSSELLGVDTRPTRSKGQILRSLLRSTKHEAKASRI